jgi:signal transduction histidine kinase
MAGPTFAIAPSRTNADMTLRARFALSLLTIAIALLVPLGLALRAVNGVQRELNAMTESEFEASLVLGGLREELSELSTKDVQLFALRDSASLNAMRRSATRIDSLTNSLDNLELEDEALKVRKALGSIRPSMDDEYAFARDQLWDKADSISSNIVSPAIRRATEGVRLAEQQISERTRDRVSGAEQELRDAWLAAAVALVVSLALAVGVAVRLTRAVEQPVAELQRGMAAVADGELSPRLRLDASRPDEFGRLAVSFDSMTRQLKELDKLKAEFVSIASHELKTPINVIIGYLELLSDSVYGEISAKQREVIRVVQAQAHTLARLAKQLLDVSRFEAGGGKIEPRSVSLPRLVDELEQAFHVLAIQKGVRFAVTRGEGLPSEVVWDADRINEVVGNLLSNAFKFTERGGEVELRVARADDDVHFSVRDTGAGIPADQLPRVFDKFYQADNQRHASRHGTGLGLAIAKGIVEAHGGTIGVESTRGVGTTFEITLPSVVAGARRPQPRESAPVAQAV